MKNTNTTPSQCYHNLHLVNGNIVATIRVSLRLDIVRNWKERKDPFVRSELKGNIAALRVMRNTATLFQEKHIFAK